MAKAEIPLACIKLANVFNAKVEKNSDAKAAKTLRALCVKTYPLSIPSRPSLFSSALGTAHRVKGNVQTPPQAQREDADFPAMCIKCPRTDTDDREF